MLALHAQGSSTKRGPMFGCGATPAEEELPSPGKVMGGGVATPPTQTEKKRDMRIRLPVRRISNISREWEATQKFVTSASTNSQRSWCRAQRSTAA